MHRGEQPIVRALTHAFLGIARRGHRDVDRKHGRFGFDEYVEHLIRFLEVIGPGAHIVAV